MDQFFHPATSLRLAGSGLLLQTGISGTPPPSPIATTQDSMTLSSRHTCIPAGNTTRLTSPQPSATKTYPVSRRETTTCEASEASCILYICVANIGNETTTNNRRRAHFGTFSPIYDKVQPRDSRKFNTRTCTKIGHNKQLRNAKSSSKCVHFLGLEAKPPDRVQTLQARYYR